jgi:hypothetical protein
MSTEPKPTVAALEPLIGEWTIQVPFAPDARGHAVFEWALGGAFVVERSEAPDPAPDGLCVIAANEDGDGYLQHYFDSRGVVRLYAMTFEDGVWTLERTKPDFTPLSFSQRYRGTFSDDGATIEGQWESSPDGSAWELDFELTYRRA